MSTSDNKILSLLKMRGPQPTVTIATALDITTVGARQHLSQLQQRELVTAEDRRESVGRPKRYWQLTAKAQEHFPDSHAVLTVELLSAIRTTFGESGLDKLIIQRERESLKSYRQRLRHCTDLASKVEALASMRSEEGYMAQWQQQQDGSYLLIENHCPICAAARECQGFCRSELDIFRTVLGRKARVERTDHITAGARRCAYRIEHITDHTKAK